MATLTQAAYYARRTIKIGLIVLLSFIVLRTAFGMAKNVWQKLRPPPPPPPTTAFNKLPQIEFGEEPGHPELTFQLETISGGLPKLDTIGKVYFMPIQTSSLLALDRAKQKARSMGFVTQPEKIAEVVYRWQALETPTTLEMNINTGNFILRYPYQEDPTLLTEKNLPTNEQAASEARRFLQSNGYLEEDLASGQAEFTYLRLLNGSLTPAISLSEADFVRVNLFRATLDGLKILPPNPRDALVSFLFSGSRDRNKRILEIKYTYFPIEREISATYPLKSVNNAWQELQSGEGYLANLGENQEGKITVRTVYLAYFDSGQEQNFLQPIFVFEGDRNFFGYVPAVSPEWVEQSPPKND